MRVTRDRKNGGSWEGVLWGTARAAILCFLGSQAGILTLALSTYFRKSCSSRAQQPPAVYSIGR